MSGRETKCLDWCRVVDGGARNDLVYRPYGDKPMSLNVIMGEVLNDTELGKKIMKEWGF